MRKAIYAGSFDPLTYGHTWMINEGTIKTVQMKTYYVYRITDVTTNEFYIGSRGFDGNPSEDNYMGSPHTWKPNKNNLKKEIIKSEFKSQSEAILIERKLIIKNINHPLNRNYGIPHPSITREGLISAKSTDNGKLISISSKDPLFGTKYVGCTKGFVVVKDKNGNTFKTEINNPLYISGELKHVFVGMKGPLLGKRWINNGKEQIIVDKRKFKKLVSSGDWSSGTLQKGKQTPSSHVGTIWVHSSKESIRIKKEEKEIYINKGYKEGRGKLGKYKK